MISPEVFNVSWLYQDGLAAGRAEGVAKGELDGRRSALMLALKAKFPTLAAGLDLDQFDRPEVLDELLLAVSTSQTIDQVEAAYQSALRPN